jgi:hypothetical protein
MKKERAVFVRTVTYHYVGVVQKETPTILVLTKCAWIADSGRFADAMASGNFSEVEPYPPTMPVTIYKQSIVDCCPYDSKKLPLKQL